MRKDCPPIIGPPWIKKIRKSEKRNDYLASQSIMWQFNLSKSPWLGGMYERLIKEIKKTLYKTLGKRPLTYVEEELGEGRVLTPNAILWGQNSYTLEEDFEEEDLTRI